MTQENEDITAKTNQLKREVNEGQKTPQEATNELRDFVIARTEETMDKTPSEEQIGDISMTAKEIVEQTTTDVWEQMIENLVKRLSSSQDLEVTSESTTTAAETRSP